MSNMLASARFFSTQPEGDEQPKSKGKFFDFLFKMAQVDKEVKDAEVKAEK